ncbi:hypothetical protein SPRG_01565 [Saprolegnia parasitica CBS 223.65]|uniref:Alpha-type protein kinase domain-containing protein n=1 Tax=Saprolegnia parasitica (strain CBS 223.65) TaxID=695850 RepID=A0A067CYT6_SAPPC|nr:hypothetical protein SPRG_01565 [Saprolegnia parasitica CBS 223.65]KDO34430.1 hypothetical protein SPRG_01565 [Saprolegnia parasitica CBS 223.65]|eukprot:XP_012195161.1 hypothetical protein SPRG_01565 [Saprolegnia parasitica CBS 223.65]
MEKGALNRLRSSSAHMYSISGQRTAENQAMKMNTFPADIGAPVQDAGEAAAVDEMPSLPATLLRTHQRSIDETMVWSTVTPTEIAPTASSDENSVVSRIATLSVLRDQGFIDEDEFQRRKKAIIDELTYPRRIGGRGALQPGAGLPLIVAHPPNFGGLVPEDAIRHMFNYTTRQWETSKVTIVLDETPFAKGSLRLVYHLQDITEAATTYVAKVAIDPDEDPETYFRDIELQAHCAHYAEMYNEYKPPKRVAFIEAWVLELKQRSGALCAVERYIPGEYRKHNNNFGSVSDEERNTPQAFSHFTYEVSNHELLAVDIQGVGDRYTDPQIHTLNGHDFGKGNLGALGFQKFLHSHRCNSICTYLKLPPVNPKERYKDYGTVPVQELMNSDRIKEVRFESKHYYENAPMLQKYVAQCKEDESAHPTASTRACHFCGLCAIQ